MKIDDKIVKTYLAGEDLEQFRNDWYYANSELSLEYGKNVFTPPPSKAELLQRTKQVYNTLLSLFKDFTPNGLALELYDGLYPHWKEIADDVYVDLIVGFPHPHDAVVCNDPTGKLHMIFDIPRWTPMIEYDLSGEAKGIVSHELFHVLMHTQFPQGEDEDAEDYVKVLDEIVFHEGFAHLVQLAGYGKLDLHGEKLTNVHMSSREKLRLALTETDPQRQAVYRHEANCGNYYDKYGAMAGMLYLAELWEAGGISALREALNAGPIGFARKAC